MVGDISTHGMESEWCQRYRVAPDLPSLFYLPGYVGAEEEDQLLREIRASKAKWVQLSGRRLQNLGGVVHAKGLIPAPLPTWIQPLLQRLAAEGGEGGLYSGREPNHVLVNSYMPGEGIMPHEDGPAYHPVVAILSLGAPAVLRFRRKLSPEGGVASPSCGPNCRWALPSGTASAELQPRQAQPQSREPQQPSQPSQQTSQPPHGGARGDPPSEADPDEVGPADPGSTQSGAGTPPPALSASTNSDRDLCEPVASSTRPASCCCYCRGPYLASILLQPRSLVVFREAAFTDCLHSIEEVSEELLDESVANLGMYGLSPGTTLPRRCERISLTVRRVARVMPAFLRR